MWGGEASGEPSSGLLAGVAVGENLAGAQKDSRRDSTGETAAEERRDVTRELHALPSTLLERELSALPRTLLDMLPEMLPSFGWSTVLSTTFTR